MSATAYSQLGHPVELMTPLGPDALFLTGLTGREGVSRLYQFDLELLAENKRTIPFDKLLGQPVNVRLTVGVGKSRYFAGIVSRFSQGTRDTTFTRYRAEVVPNLWLLTRRAQSRIFQHQTVPDILKKVFDGIDVDYGGLQGKFHPRNYCVQYRESDFAFASRLMEEEGIFYFFKHTKDGHQLVVANTPLAHPEVPEQAKVIFEELTGGNRPEYRITGWEKVQEVRPGKVTLWDHSFELPDKNLAAEKLPPESVTIGQVTHPLRLPGGEHREIYDYPGGYVSRFDGIDAGGEERPADVSKLFEDNERTANIRIQAEAAAALRIQGTGNCRQFTSGHTFTLSRHFNADGAYLLTDVEHHIRHAGDLRSGDGVALVYENKFTCIPQSLAFRPARTTPKPRVEGSQTAVVVGPQGEEIFCDKYGRVKVQFHWDREGKSDGNSSCWVRVATPWAGRGWGGIHIPRIGQEVVVDFLEGDPDRPLIVGSVFNADVMPPFELPAGKRLSGFRTSSTPHTGGSNEITFDDTKGKERVTVHAQYDKNVTVDHDMTTTVHNNRASTVDVNSTELVKGKKTTTVNGTVLETYNDALSTIVKSGTLLTSTGANVHVIAATEVMLNSGASTLLMKSDGTIELVGVNIFINGKSLVQADAPKIAVNGGSETIMGVGGQTVHCDGGQTTVTGAAIVSAAEGTHDIKGALVKIN
jgi:type VI secretion system secreted protein VgrG